MFVCFNTNIFKSYLVFMDHGPWLVVSQIWVFENDFKATNKLREHGKTEEQTGSVKFLRVTKGQQVLSALACRKITINLNASTWCQVALPVPGRARFVFKGQLRETVGRWPLRGIGNGP